MRSSRLAGAVLLLLAGCDEPGPSEWDWPPEPRCELLETRSPQLGELEPSAEFRIACGKHAPIGAPSIVVSADATWVLADGSTAIAEAWRLYRIADGEFDVVTWRENASTSLAVLASSDDGDAWLFASRGYSRALELARLDASSAALELELLGSNGWIERVEIAGSTPQLWFSNERHELMRATIDAHGEWVEMPALAVEGVDVWKPRVGLDGAGRQIAYAAKSTPDYAIEIWAHDGHTTKLLGSFADLSWAPAEPIPTAHPGDVDHEHAAYVERESGVTVLWPDSGDTVSVPWSPSFADPSCLVTSRVVSARTSDGRMWLAWVVYGLPSCNVPGTEAPTLRLIEIDPTQRSAGERMRLELDHAHLGFSQRWSPSLDVRIAITSHADQLALVIPDGPADQRLHVVQVDVHPD